MKSEQRQQNAILQAKITTGNSKGICRCDLIIEAFDWKYFIQKQNFEITIHLCKAVYILLQAFLHYQ